MNGRQRWFCGVFLIWFALCFHAFGQAVQRGPLAPGVRSVKVIEVISRGKRVDIERSLVRGKITLVDFYADWCGPCREISPHLEKLARGDADVVLRKVDIVGWGSEVCRQYQIQSVPQVWVYDRDGRLVGKVLGARLEQVYELVARAR